MIDELSLRPATMADAAMLLAWRNDPATRDASHSTDEVMAHEHRAWLRRCLDDDCRRLWIGEHDGVGVGTVRADQSAGGWELSWTVAPAARGRGIARAMVAAAVVQLCGPISAQVKTGNQASIRVAEHLGMVLTGQAHGVMHFRRDR